MAYIMTSLRKIFLFLSLLFLISPSCHNNVLTKKYPSQEGDITSFYGFEKNSTKLGWNEPSELELALEGKFRPLIIIFSATWCGPCRVLRQYINEMEWRRYILIVNIDEEKVEEISENLSFGDSIPALYYLNQNNEEYRFVGFGEIVDFLDIFMKKEEY